MRLELLALPGIPLIEPGNDLPGLVLAAAQDVQLTFQDGDVLVVAQKAVSKAENRLVYLPAVRPTDHARELAAITRKDPRLVQVVLNESVGVLRAVPNVLIVEHRLGFVCANAGVDHSNTFAPPGAGPFTRRDAPPPADHHAGPLAPWGDGRQGASDWVLLLPEDPDSSARRIRQAIADATGADVAVIINDSHGRAWRLGTVGVAIGVAGMRPLSDLRGRLDLTGRPLQITVVGTADEIAAAASLVMGQAAERTPVVLARGATFVRGDGKLAELLRPRELDLFRGTAQQVPGEHEGYPLVQPSPTTRGE